MKKTISILLCILMMVMLFAGCGETPATDVVESEDPATESTVPSDDQDLHCRILRRALHSYSLPEERAAAHFSLYPMPLPRSLTKNTRNMLSALLRQLLEALRY